MLFPEQGMERTSSEHVGSKTSRNYSYKVSSIATPNGETSSFGPFEVHDEGNIIFRAARLGPVRASFIYDVRSRCLTSNVMHSMLPMEIGGLWPPGNHLADIMALDLLKDEGLLFIHGGAFRLDGETICVFSPGRTGKTTAVDMLLRKGARYIGEDAILTDGRTVHLVPPHEPEKLSMPNKNDVVQSSKIDRIYICENGSAKHADERARAVSLLSIFSNRVPFSNDGLVQAMISHHGLDFRELEDRSTDVVEGLVDNTDVRLIGNINEMMTVPGGHQDPVPGPPKAHPISRQDVQQG